LPNSEIVRQAVSTSFPELTRPAPSRQSQRCRQIRGLGLKQARKGHHPGPQSWRRPIQIRS